MLRIDDIAKEVPNLSYCQRHEVENVVELYANTLPQSEAQEYVCNIVKTGRIFAMKKLYPYSDVFDMLIEEMRKRYLTHVISSRERTTDAKKALAELQDQILTHVWADYKTSFPEKDNLSILDRINLN